MESWSYLVLGGWPADTHLMKREENIVTIRIYVKEDSFYDQQLLVLAASCVAWTIMYRKMGYAQARRDHFPDNGLKHT